MSARVKIQFPFENPEGVSEIETMWALKREEGYEIENIPFHAREVALGDIVAATADPDGLLRYAGLVRAGGHSTIQILFAEEGDVPQVRNELRQMGCDSELSSIPRLIGVDVPAEIPYSRVESYLKQGAAAGRFEYSEACLGFV